MAKPRKLLVAAIDCCSTYSSCACSFYYDFKSDPMRIKVSQWTEGPLLSFKTPTTILFDKDQKFHSFGYKAEDHYSQLAEDDNHTDWYYFRRFKMILFDIESKGGQASKVMIKDIRDREVPAVKVFSEAIRYLKGYVLNEQEKRSTQVKDDDIEWVLIVPATSNESVKQFMRLAAETAGITLDQLTIVLEPVAVSQYCKYLPSEQGFAGFSKGSKYLILDAGEERTDVTVLEMQSDGSSKVIHTACEWLLGMGRVFKAFHQMLIRIFGKDVMDKCMTNCSDVYDDISRDISIKLRAVEIFQSNKITWKVPAIIIETSKGSGLPIQDAIDQTDLKGKITLVGDRMRMDANLFRELCADALDSTRLFVHGVLAHRSCKETDVIIMTGEFSSSPLLQESIKSAFSNMRVIIPPNNEHAALAGAVIFAHARLPFKPQCSSSDPQVRSRGKYPPYRHRE